MSRNNANTCLRIFNSIQYYGLGYYKSDFDKWSGNCSLFKGL
ncbi:MAG: hypothetical protein ACLR4N_11490 [Mediterraneibacter faecis]